MVLVRRDCEISYAGTLSSSVRDEGLENEGYAVGGKSIHSYPRGAIIAAGAGLASEKGCLVEVKVTTESEHTDALARREREKRPE